MVENYASIMNNDVWDVSIINPLLTKLSIKLIQPYLGVLINKLIPLVPLGPHGLMGTHVPVTRVYGALLEVISN